MVQIIPRARTGSDRLSEGLIKGSQSASQLIPKHLQNQETAKLIESQFPASSPHKILAQAYRSGAEPAEIKALSDSLIGIQKQQKSGAEEQEVRQRGQLAFNEMANILKKGNLGRTSKIRGFLGGETAKDAAQFNSLGGAIEAMLVDLVSRGTLSNARFKYITETLLPKPNDLEDEIQGKLEALALELGLDASELGISQSPNNKKSSGFVKMQTPDGKVVRVPHDKAEAASKAGGKIIK